MTSASPNSQIAINYRNVVREPITIDGNSITGRVLQNPDFSKFASILKKSRLAARLSELQANFTLFVPSDKTISKLPSNMDEGMAQEIVLGSLLENVIGSGTLKESPMRYFPTKLRAHDLLVTNFKNYTFLNKHLYITQFDMRCSNGMIHVINDVIRPNYNPNPDLNN